MVWVRCDNPSCQACRYAALARLKPWNDLQRRLLAVQAERHVTFVNLAQLVGATRGSLKRWFSSTGSGLPKEVLARIAEMVSLTVDDALHEAGGVTAESRRAAAAARLRVGENRVCPECGRETWVQHNQAVHWRACDQACLAHSKLGLQAWNTLQVRILADLKRTHRSFEAFVRAAGLPPFALRGWFRLKGSTTEAATLERVAMALGIPVEQAIAEAGGVTAKEKRREGGSRLFKASHPLSDEARRRGASKISRALKGRSKDPVSIAQAVRTRRERGGYDRSLAILGVIARSDQGRTRLAFFGLLNGNPKPTPATIKMWAEKQGKKRRLPVGAVLEIWRPHLEKLGLTPPTKPSGRPPNERRCRLIGQLIVGWPMKADGDLADGFWPMALDQVRKLEGVDKHGTPRGPAGADKLAKWWREHQAVCRRSARAA